MSSFPIIVQMDIIFSRTKNFKNAKIGKTFHKIIEESISNLKPNGDGPIKSQIRMAKCYIRNNAATEFTWTLNLSVSKLNEEITKSLMELRSGIKKDFEKWGKYHVILKQMTAISALE
ncbi:MAG: hypothetical protein HRU07_03175 [Nitrosopumilus sp.]|nr:hypothetical protein [Nitrosopumilus sp.]NRA05164.1 hypothetical protein [Nitrosopumilus sp.]